MTGLHTKRRECLLQNVNMVFLFLKNPFIKAGELVDTKNLLHSYIGYSKRTLIWMIGCCYDSLLDVLLSACLKNAYISSFILFQNSLTSISY